MKVMIIFSIILFVHTWASCQDDQKTIVVEIQSATEFYTVVLGFHSRFIGEDDEYLYVETSLSGQKLGPGESPKEGQQIIQILKNKIDKKVFGRVLFEHNRPYQGIILQYSSSIECSNWRIAHHDSLKIVDYNKLRTPEADSQAETIIEEIKKNRFENPNFPQFEIVECDSEQLFWNILYGEPSRYEGYDDQWCYLSTSSPDRVLEQGESPHPYESICKIKRSSISSKELSKVLELKNQVNLSNYPQYPDNPDYLIWSSKVLRNAGVW